MLRNSLRRFLSLNLFLPKVNSPPAVAAFAAAPITYLLLAIFVTSPPALGFGENSLKKSNVAANPLRAEAHFQPTVTSPGGTLDLVIALDLEKNYHAYVDKFKVTIDSPDDLKVDVPRLAPTIEFADPFSKKVRTSVIDRSTLKATVEVPSGFAQGKYVTHIKLIYQACTLEHCLFPKTIDLQAAFSVSAEGQSTAVVETRPTSTTNSLSTSINNFNLGKILEQGLGLTLLLLFVMGFLTSLTPCIYPMIPITLAVLGTHTRGRSPGKGFSLSLVYTLGIALTYSTFGVIAARTGALFGSSLSNVWVVSAIALVFVAMALSMFGFFEIQAPAYIRNRLGTARMGHGYLAAFAAGLIAGVVASPCVGPVLVSILAYIAKTQNALLGFGYLFVFSIGMGLPFLVLGASSSLLQRLPRAGHWMEITKTLFGSVMLGMAIYYINPIYPRWLTLLLAGGAILFVGFFVSDQAVLEAKKQVRMQNIFRKLLTTVLWVVGATLIALGTAYRFGVNSVGGVDFSISTHDRTRSSPLAFMSYSESELNAALAARRPVMIDFYADWCLACEELEEKTYPAPAVQALKGDFVFLKVDATNDSPELELVKAKYKVIGLPTLIFYDRSGKIREDLTLTGFEKADEFAARMQSALANK